MILTDKLMHVGIFLYILGYSIGGCPLRTRILLKSLVMTLIGRCLGMICVCRVEERDSHLEEDGSSHEGSFTRGAGSEGHASAESTRSSTTIERAT